MIKLNRWFSVSVLIAVFTLWSVMSPSLAQLSSSDAAVRLCPVDECYETAGTFYGLLSTPLCALSQGALQRDLSGANELMEDLSFEFELPLEHLPENLELDAYIVYSSELDTLERLVLDSLTSEALFQSRAEVHFGGKTSTKELTINKHLVQDNETDLDRLSAGTTMIILVGSRAHNRITADVYDAGYITNESSKYRDQVVIGKGKVDTDSNVMSIYHKVAGEEERLEREAVKYSPLSDFMPEAYVPIAATGIGIILMHFFNIFKTIAEFLTLKIGRKKKTFGYTGLQIKGIHLKEIGALLGASFVLGFAVTWTFTGPSLKFFDLIFLNAGICLFAALSHEVTHRLIGRFFGIKMEYRFWYGGSLITILTAFLGNSFGIQGFLLEKGEDDISSWKYGVTKLAAPLVSMFIAMAFALLYLKNPGVIFQMVYTTASIWAMAEIFPVEGLDGYDVKNWNRLVCFIFLILISIVFFAINFIQ